MTADTPNGGGWQDDPTRVGLTISLPNDLFAQLVATMTAGESVNTVIEARLRRSVTNERILDALARIEAKLDAKVEETMSQHLARVMLNEEAMRAGFINHEQREAARKLRCDFPHCFRSEDEARMVPHGTDMRPGGITRVADGETMSQHLARMVLNAGPEREDDGA